MFRSENYDKQTGKDDMQYLWYSNVTTTETYYAHLIEESRVKAGECIADVMLRGYDGKGEKLSS